MSKDENTLWTFENPLVDKFEIVFNLVFEENPSESDFPNIELDLILVIEGAHKTIWNYGELIHNKFDIPELWLVRSNIRTKIEEEMLIRNEKKSDHHFGKPSVTAHSNEYNE
jgi:hypothetical protein